MESWTALAHEMLHFSNHTHWWTDGSLLDSHMSCKCRG